MPGEFHSPPDGGRTPLPPELRPVHSDLTTHTIVVQSMLSGDGLEVSVEFVQFEPSGRIVEYTAILNSARVLRDAVRIRQRPRTSSGRPPPGHAREATGRARSQTCRYAGSCGARFAFCAVLRRSVRVP